MTPADYLTTIVLPTLAEFMEAPAAPRRAYLACIATAHMVDHIARAISADNPDKYAVRQAVRVQGGYARETLAIIEGISNGTKHADPKHRGAFKFVPGNERRREAFEFDKVGAGLDEARWDIPGLSVSHEGRTYFIDDCVRGTVWAFVRTYPDHLGSVDLGVTRPEFDRWGAPV